jgi:hypothetical protein
MARDHFRLQVSIWGDDDFKALQRDPQRMYMTLCSQANLSYCGVMDYIPRRLALLAKDETEDSVQAAVKHLEAERFVVVDLDTYELLIRSFVRWDGLLDSPNMTKAMLKARSAVISGHLRDVIDVELARAYSDDPKKSGWKGLRDAAPDLFQKVMEMGSRKGSEKGSSNGSGKGESE